MDTEDFLANADIPVYYKLFEAVKYQTEVDASARPFSFESRHLNEGRRRFICVPLQKFHQFYEQQVGPLNFYEIIQENRPCRAYFDLEYYKVFNENLDSMACFQAFISLCRDTFKQLLNIEVEENRFMILDSSTDLKFSAHVIVHLPEGRLFANHLALKHFVDAISTEMIKQKKCLVQKDDDKVTYLCDLGVYTRNRNFRLYYSSKLGKETRLEYASYCKFYAKKPFDKRIFLDSLVLPENYSECPLIYESDTVPESQTQFKNFMSQDGALVNNVPCKVSNVMQNQSSSRTNDSQTSNNDVKPKRTIRDLCKSRSPSPFSALDRWFISLIKEQFPNASIRLWTISYVEAFDRRQIQYALNNCRYCHNIKREHKSQNVFWIVNLENFIAFQRCFDSDCRNFTSDFYPVANKVKEECRKLIDPVFGKFGILPQEILISDENSPPSKKSDSDIEVLDEVPKKMPKIEQ